MTSIPTRFARCPRRIPDNLGHGIPARVSPDATASAGRDRVHRPTCTWRVRIPPTLALLISCLHMPEADAGDITDGEHRTPQLTRIADDPPIAQCPWRPHDACPARPQGLLHSSDSSSEHFGHFGPLGRRSAVSHDLGHVPLPPRSRHHRITIGWVPCQPPIPPFSDVLFLDSHL